ncbi:class I SAM-dependent methyltransferase [Leptolyngbya sp. NK1-12]|uniref:Class I SAM-dependent methyltransferase n=1 Tax=Leptolyngbya sp. NK1-12 TaxID=2547451 RepID=A0AA96WJC8_9CYAN|nr:class I SAM-dependent methyltransferase [Leptolyngbya sp. NK1-12]WNZ26224.1 class I SAM-dependent methyltransferase [Leptolyngbya sp. NK1-12]
MATQPLATDSNPALCQLIAQQIAASPEQRITFAEFMELALYQPQYGYYATNRGQAGIQRDFFTSPHLGSDFGELLAEQFADLWHQLGCPHPFILVEMGAGQGLLVQDIVHYLHRHQFECFAALEYWIIEKSPALIVAQQQRLRSLTDSWGKLVWHSWEEIPSNSIVGCCFSNELVDALPVHLVEVTEGNLQEVYVALDSKNQIREVIAPLSTRQIEDYFRLIDIDLLSDRYPQPYRTEVNLAALDWLSTVADRLQRGYLLTIDYGYPAHRYYSPTRDQGTLQCYTQHAHHNDPYIAIGQQDITAHVNFTALERQGEQCGLQTIGFTQQGLFLMALGLGERLNALSNPTPDQTVQEILKRRETLHALIDPTGLGNFGVLVQAKGVDPSQSLKGLTVPPLFG